MKKIITLIAIIISICVNCYGQTKVYSSPESLGIDYDWNDGISFINENADTIIYKILSKNDSIRVVIYRDTISDGKYIQYVVYDWYKYNGKIYFIYSREILKDFYVCNEPKRYAYQSLYTTEPNTSVRFAKEGESIRYVFYNDCRSNLSKEEIAFFIKKGLISETYNQYDW